MSGDATRRLTDLLGAEVADGDRRVGTLRDLTLRPGSGPALAGLLVATSRRGAPRHLPWSAVRDVDPRRVAVAGEAAPPEPGAGEIGLREDVLDVQVYDTTGRRFGRVGEVWLAGEGPALRVAGVSLGLDPVLHRLGFGRLARAPERIIAWEDVNLQSGHARGLQVDARAPGARRSAGPPSGHAAHPLRRAAHVIDLIAERLPTRRRFHLARGRRR